jgi:hypothetical protein
MRFLVHGVIHPDTQAALIRRGHACHAGIELSEQTDAPAEMASDAALLLPALEKKQWALLTSDSEFVRQVYEKGIAFSGVIVLLLETGEGGEGGSLAGQAEGIERLFARYPRLTPRRLYTVTPNRVKIRQLPGARRR